MKIKEDTPDTSIEFPVLATIGKKLYIIYKTPKDYSSKYKAVNLESGSHEYYHHLTKFKLLPVGSVITLTQERA